MANEDYNAQEQLDPRVELSGDDAAELEPVGGDVSADYDAPQTAVGGTSADKATADAMADLVVYKLEGQARGTVAVYNKGATNSLTYEILGSLDNGKTFDVTVVAAAAIAGGAAPALTNWTAAAGAGATNAVYTHLKVRVRSTTAATPTTAASKAAFATF